MPEPAVPEVGKPTVVAAKTCIHCNGTKKIMHGGEVACPWCAGGPQGIKGSK